MNRTALINIESRQGQSILNKVNEIAQALINKPVTAIKNPGLMSGKSGVALFLFYYANYTNNQKAYDNAVNYFSSSIEDIENGFNYPTHADGIGGIGNVLQLADNEGFFESDCTELYEAFDEYLSATLLQEFETNNWDFLHGSIGIALYFFNRLPHSKALNNLENFVQYLEKISETDGFETKWFSVSNHEKVTKGYNLSLSHGIASIISILLKIYTAGIAKNKTLYLLKGAVNYLLKQQLDLTIHNFYFPSWVIEKEKPKSSRLAWCYGDLGIGISLWNAGKATNNKEWINKAIEILLYTAKRRKLEENLVKDAGLCHGSAGIAHIYNRIFQLTGINEFKEASIYWLKITMDFSHQQKENASFDVYRKEDFTGEKNYHSFLEGNAGIGLALLSAISNKEPKWDELLLIS